MRKVELAVSYFNQGFACSQAILSAYGEEFGLSRDLALKMGEGFAGGMAGMGKTCGAVVAAVMVIGLKYGRIRVSDKRARAKTAGMTKRFFREFEARNKSMECRTLLGCEIDTPSKIRHARRLGLFRTVCPQAVRVAAEILEEIT